MATAGRMPRGPAMNDVITSKLLLDALSSAGLRARRSRVGYLECTLAALAMRLTTDERETWRAGSRRRCEVSSHRDRGPALPLDGEELYRHVAQRARGSAHPLRASRRRSSSRPSVATRRPNPSPSREGPPAGNRDPARRTCVRRCRAVRGDVPGRPSALRGPRRQPARRPEAVERATEPASVESRAGHAVVRDGSRGSRRTPGPRLRDRAPRGCKRRTGEARRCPS